MSAANAEEDIGWKTKNEGFHRFMAFSYKYFFCYTTRVLQVACCDLCVGLCVASRVLHRRAVIVKRVYRLRVEWGDLSEGDGRLALLPCDRPSPVVRRPRPLPVSGVAPMGP